MDQPNTECWHVLGRIADQLGLVEAARADYAKVTKPDLVFQLSTYRLAQARLAALSASAAPAAAGKAGAK